METSKVEQRIAWIESYREYLHSEEHYFLEEELERELFNLRKQLKYTEIDREI